MTPGPLPSHSKIQMWQRNAPPAAIRNITFMLTDVDTFKNTIRLYGVTAAANSVCVHVEGFIPYFYCDLIGTVSEFAAELDRQVYGATHEHLIKSVEECERIPLMNYAFETKRRLLKISVESQRDIRRVSEVLEAKSINLYENNVPFVLRYMVDKGIVGGCWISAVLEEKRYMTHCQVEGLAEEITPHPTDGEYARIAPVRILSFDIECAGRKGHFPDASVDPVIVIAVHAREGEREWSEVRGVKDATTACGTSFTVVERELSEVELLDWFAGVIREFDPDILTGYNVQNFDLPYLLNRAKAIGMENFDLLGRVKKERTVMRDKVFSSAAFGTRKSVETVMHGRIMMDVIHYMYRNQKMSSYSLNAVSEEFLGERKEDVHHSMITPLFNGTDEDRARLKKYCLKDALLPMRLIDKLMILVNYVEMARVTGVPLTYLFSRGQQIKILSMIYRKTMGVYAVPYIKKVESDEEITYEGATVLPPIAAFYDVPIATLDFASLYPSIMQAHNLCYTTLIAPRDVHRVPEEDRELSPAGHWFVRAKRKEGLLPAILTGLLSARKKAKKDMAAAKTDFEKAVMNGRQLALKVSANSVYGFTGATIGALPCLEISSSVTAYGRTMIEKTRAMVEAHYNIAGGYSHDAKVVYGDTDSVMVRFGVPDVKTSMELGLDAAKRATKLFPPPVSLEFEKVYYPYLLMAKKRYAGVYWSKPEKYDKVDAKGIEIVRRDFCGLVQRVVRTCLNKILLERDIPGAVSYAQGAIGELLQGKVDISELIISKSLAADYKNQQPHVELAKKMRKRDPGSAPVTGDRVPYVIIPGAKGQKNFELAEDPLWALEHNLSPDAGFYLEHQLKGPLERLFEHVVPDVGVLFRGDHTRSIVKSTPAIGIALFAKARPKCVTCGAVGKAPVCGGCDKGVAEGVERGKVGALQERFDALWKRCQECQGSEAAVICGNTDCDIFYARKKAGKDLEEGKKVLELF